MIDRKAQAQRRPYKQLSLYRERAWRHSADGEDAALAERNDGGELIDSTLAQVAERSCTRLMSAGRQSTLSRPINQLLSAPSHPGESQLVGMPNYRDEKTIIYSHHEADVDRGN